jgi:pescadillo protein
MLTFLDLYQTLLGFVFFKLYTDAGLVYPPPLDTIKDEDGAGVGAFSLRDASCKVATFVSTQVVEVDGKKVSSRDVRQTIKNISAVNYEGDGDTSMAVVDTQLSAEDEEFVVQPSTSDTQPSFSLPTLQSLSVLPQSPSASLFSPYTFFISRETSRAIFEFIVRSFGGRVGWLSSAGSGSPFDETDDSITHVIIDRPLIKRPNESTEDRERRLRRKYVQPQWIVDCVNAGKILLEEPYEQGKTLPPHLSPFGEYEGAYDPTIGLSGQNMVAESGDKSQEESVFDNDQGELGIDEIALKAATDAAVMEDDAALRAAELTAEVAGIDSGVFEKEVSKSRTKSNKAMAEQGMDMEKDMNKMMMSNKQKKLYERMKHGEKKRALEVRKFSVSLTLLTTMFSEGYLGAEEAESTKAQRASRQYMTPFNIPRDK